MYCDGYFCLFVCRSIHWLILETIRPIFTKFFVLVASGRGSLLLWRHCDMLRTSGFENGVIFSLEPYGTSCGTKWREHNSRNYCINVNCILLSDKAQWIQIVAVCRWRSLLSTKFLHGRAPSYLGLRDHVADVSGNQALCSTCTNFIIVPPVTSTTAASLGFSVAAPLILNSLPLMTFFPLSRCQVQGLSQEFHLGGYKF